MKPVKMMMIASLALVAIAMYGCPPPPTVYYVEPEPLVINTPPPPEPVHVVVDVNTCPGGHVWVNAYHHWNGHAWVMVQGQCVNKPGYVWVGPSYVHVHGGVKYVKGYWKPGKTKVVVTAKPPPKPPTIHVKPKPLPPPPTVHV
ncbi:MAG: hypothetical protein ABIJ56_24305, partial [Pseudomonadota bacterium]